MLSFLCFCATKIKSTSRTSSMSKSTMKRKSGDSGRPTKKMKPTVQTLAKKIDAMAKSQEVKIFDKTSAELGVHYNVANVGTMFSPARGTTSSQIVGDFANLLRIVIRGTIRQTGAPGFLRLSLIRSKQRFVPESDDASQLQGVWALGGTSNAVNSQWLYENRHHFKVLHDQTFALGDESVGGGDAVQTFLINKKLDGEFRYAFASTTADEGQVYLLMTSSFATTGGPFVAYSSRIFYTDN